MKKHISFIILLFIFTALTSYAGTDKELSMRVMSRLGMSLLDHEELYVPDGWHIERIDMESKKQYFSKKDGAGEQIVVLYWEGTIVVEAAMLETYVDVDTMKYSLEVSVARMTERYGKPENVGNTYLWYNESSGIVSLIETVPGKPRVLLHRLTYMQNL